MFSGCSNLTSAPQLPATTLADRCYQYMFADCTSLSTPPQLPATILANYCYYLMFSGCISLTSAPQLPAITLTSGCYYWMFGNCTNLLSAKIDATNVNYSNCMYQMFNNCSKLSSLQVNFTSWPGSNATSNWVKGVALKGNFIKPEALSTKLGNSYIPYGWDVYNKINGNLVKVENIYSTIPFTVLTPIGSTLKFSKTGSPTSTTIKYKQDTATSWSTLGLSTSTSTGGSLGTSSGYVYCFSGTTQNFSKDNSNCYRFYTSRPVALFGRLNSLVSGKQSMAAGQYYNLFYNTPIVDASNLVLTNTVNSYCYCCMFQRCTSLTAIPSLPATSLANHCYLYMFESCTKLSSVPQNFLPATTLANSCYYAMFQNCTSLKNAPQLPAATLIDYCYTNMFTNCSNLLSVKIDATNINYNYCMTDMFSNCSSLSSIEVNFTTWPTANDATTNWVSGVASNGQFICPAALPHDSSYFDTSHIPPGWTVITK